MDSSLESIGNRLQELEGRSAALENICFILIQQFDPSQRHAVRDHLITTAQRIPSDGPAVSFRNGLSNVLLELSSKIIL